MKSGDRDLGQCYRRILYGRALYFNNTCWRICDHVVCDIIWSKINNYDNVPFFAISFLEEIFLFYRTFKQNEHALFIYFIKVQFY